MITVAQGVVKALESEGVSVVFGYPGAAICPFFDSLSQSSIRLVLARQEQNAGHAASGCARVSGRPGVVAVTSGPGACNLIPALATAYMDSIPLVAITGQVSTEQIGRDVFQEADITGAAEPFTKYSYLVKNPKEIGQVMKEAFYIAASGRPGPVLIDLPIDMLRAKLEFHYPEEVTIRGYKPTFVGNAPQVGRVADAMNHAVRPVICLGGGVLSAGAGETAGELALASGVPMVSTMMGLSAVPSAHPLYFGMLGTYGAPAANFAVENADLIIVIGARLGDRALSAPAVLERRAKIVHIDVDPAEIGKNVGASIPLVGDAKNILTQLLACVRRGARQDWLDALDEKRNSAAAFDDAPRMGYVNPRVLMKTLSSAMEEDAIVTADVGQNQIWAARYLAITSGRLLTSGGMGTMGYAIPAAIGAKMAEPLRQVVAICGDGSLQMAMMELAVICQENLDVKILVLNNARLGLVRELQDEQYGGRHVAVELRGGPDFLKLAAAYGIPAARADSCEAAASLIGRMLGEKGPFLLECVIAPNEGSL